MRIINYLFIASLAITGLSCSDDEKPCTREISSDVLAAVDQTQLAADIATIDAYLLDNSITAVQDPTGLRFVVHQMGTGKEVCLESQLKVTYKGMLMSNGEIFEQVTEPRQFNFPMSDLILGWQIGFLKLPVGTSVTYYIPSGLAYGTDVRKDSNGNTIIFSNSNLIFDIELLDVK